MEFFGHLRDIRNGREELARGEKLVHDPLRVELRSGVPYKSLHALANGYIVLRLAGHAGAAPDLPVCGCFCHLRFVLKPGPTRIVLRLPTADRRNVSCEWAFPFSSRKVSRFEYSSEIGPASMRCLSRSIAVARCSKSRRFQLYRHESRSSGIRSSQKDFATAENSIHCSSSSSGPGSNFCVLRLRSPLVQTQESCPQSEGFVGVHSLFFRKELQHERLPNGAGSTPQHVLYFRTETVFSGGSIRAFCSSARFKALIGRYPLAAHKLERNSFASAR